MADETGWLLALDTSSDQAGIALFDGVRLFELSWPAGRDQTVSLLGQIDHLVTLAGIGIGDVRAVAVAIGPGMFSGLRVGVSVAKGLVLAGTGINLIGISTLDLAAYPWLSTGEHLLVVVPAGRDRLLWSRYVGGAGQPPVNGTATELAATVANDPNTWLLAGELTAAQRDELASVPGLRLAPRGASLRRPGCLAEMSWRRHLVGDWDDAVTLEPVYIHTGRPDRGRR